MRTIYISILALIFSFAGAAQECKVKKLVDPYTKETRLSTGLITLDGASLAVEANAKEIDFFFSMSRKESCFNDASTAVVTYDSTRMKGNFKNTGTMNCDGFFHIIFRNLAATPTLLQRLITQKITSIVFTGTGGTKTTIELSDDDKQKISILADCLVKEAKTLIK